MYTLKFSRFFKYFCFWRAIYWSEYFLNSYFSVSVFIFTTSSWFQTLSSCGKCWSCFVLLQASSFLFNHTRFLSGNLGYSGLPGQKDWSQSLWQILFWWYSYLRVKTASLWPFTFLAFWKLLCDDFENCLSWSCNRCHQALFATFWLLTASWNTLFAEFWPVLCY